MADPCWALAGLAGKDVNRPGAILEFQADLSKVQAAAELLQGLLSNGGQQLRDIVQDMQDQVRGALTSSVAKQACLMILLGKNMAGWHTCHCIWLNTGPHRVDLALL